jgi:putative addiction module component (TIGR02574 family)
MATADDLLSEMLRLPVEERAWIARELLLSLDEEKVPDAEAEWVQELERRVLEVVSGKAETYDARQAIEEVRAQLRERRGR